MPPATTAVPKPDAPKPGVKKKSSRSKKASRPTSKATMAPSRPTIRWRPSKALVAKRVTSLMQRTASPELRQAFKKLRQALKKLGRQVVTGGETATRADRLDTAVDAMLSTLPTSASDAALLLEAATWVAAWRLGSKHAGHAEAVVQTLHTHAADARDTLTSGDTIPAAFLLTVSRLLPTDTAAEDESLVWTTTETELQRLVTPTGCVTLEGSAAIVERVARWTHLRETAAATGTASRKAKQRFAGKADRRWKQATTYVLRLLGPGGSAVATESQPTPACWSNQILDAATKHGTKTIRRTARLLARKTPAKTEDKATSLTFDDRHAAVAVFRSRWQGRAVRVSLDYRSEQPHLEVASGKRMLIDGPWRWEICQDGTPLAAEGPWQVTHFEEDDEAVLIVISAPLASGLRLERHLLLAHNDRVLLLADAVVDATGDAGCEQLTYRGSLPIPQQITVDAADETRELTFIDSKPQAMLMPLALHEWRIGQAPGSCEWDADRRVVQLEQHAPVRRLFAPLWLDLSPRRFGSQITWRQLTVADTRVIVHPSQAAGFRVQAGLTQWLLYRALDEPRNRTVLGCNLSSYFRMGTLGDDGLVSQMAEW